MSDWSKQLENLFYEALNRTDPAERTAFLDQTCAGKPVLRAQVEEWLAVHAEAEKSFAKAKLATCLQTQMNTHQE